MPFRQSAIDVTNETIHSNYMVSKQMSSALITTNSPSEVQPRADADHTRTQ